MKLLIHICCGPCFIYPLEEVAKEYDVTGFFYNPNIHPYGEYLRRLEMVEEYCRKKRVPLVGGDYELESYFRAVAYHEEEPERCGFCYRLRLEQTATFAKENGFEAFTSTLLVSPYQKHEMIKEIGEETAGQSGVRFLYRDFRSGYKEGVTKSRELAMYRQKYCGCIFSERERFTMSTDDS